MKACEAQALKLAPRDRAALARHLIASLDSLEDGQIENLWLEEADRRYREYGKGRVAARAADVALRDARAALR